MTQVFNTLNVHRYSTTALKKIFIASVLSLLLSVTVWAQSPRVDIIGPGIVC